MEKSKTLERLVRNKEEVDFTVFSPKNEKFVLHGKIEDYDEFGYTILGTKKSTQKIQRYFIPKESLSNIEMEPSEYRDIEVNKLQLPKYDANRGYLIVDDKPLKDATGKIFRLKGKGGDVLRSIVESGRNGFRVETIQSMYKRDHNGTAKRIYVIKQRLQGTGYTIERVKDVYKFIAKE
jgi:hypothetical protein|tara:strand:- start:64 stop:600 length:537 start_codon:yes stop_codon:yes gene_type:complete